MDTEVLVNEPIEVDVLSDPTEVSTSAHKLLIKAILALIEQCTELSGEQFAAYKAV